MPCPSHFSWFYHSNNIRCTAQIGISSLCNYTHCLPHTVQLYLCTLWCHVEIWGTVPLILNLESRWRWPVSFTPQPLYCQRKSPRYATNRSLDTLKNRKILPLLGNNPRIHGVLAPSLTTVLTELSPLSFFLFISEAVKLTEEVWDGEGNMGKNRVMIAQFNVKCPRY
jgi:hypothetical protein